MQTKKVLGALIGMLWAAIPAANATVITTGVIEVYKPNIGAFDFDFMIGGISARGHADEGSHYFEPTFYEGDTVVGNHQYGPRTRIDMFAGDVAGDFVYWQYGRNPVATTLISTSPGAVLTRGQTLYTSTFDFSGSLCGVKQINEPVCFIAFPELTGQGIAEFFFSETVLDDGRHAFTMTKAKYTFMPVPEPTTLALFGVGFVGMALARRKRPASIETE